MSRLAGFGALILALILAIILLLSLCGGRPTVVEVEAPPAYVEVEPGGGFGLWFRTSGSEHVLDIDIDVPEGLHDVDGDCRGWNELESHQCLFRIQSVGDPGTYLLQFDGAAQFVDVLIDGSDHYQTIEHTTTVVVLGPTGDEPLVLATTTTAPATTAGAEPAATRCEIGDVGWSVSPTTFESVEGAGANVVLNSEPIQAQQPVVTVESLPVGVDNAFSQVEPSGTGGWSVFVGALAPWPDGEHRIELGVQTEQGSCRLGFTAVVSAYVQEG